MNLVLKEALKSKQISQSRLSQLARIPASSISYIVQGKLSPGPTWRARISEALECPEDVLFGDVLFGDANRLHELTLIELEWIKGRIKQIEKTLQESKEEP